MKNIKKMVDSFKWRRINTSIYGFNPHEALIGEWIRWWLTDSKLGDRHSRAIINPAIYAKLPGGKKCSADLLFCKKDNRGRKGFYKVVGVAEIENNKKNYLAKLNSLSAYDRATEKFIDLKFALLSTWFEVDSEGEVDSEEDLKLIKRIEKRMTEISKAPKTSETYWIFYILKKQKIDEDSAEEFWIEDYVKDSDTFYYNRRFKGKPEYIIFRNGKEVSRNF